MLNGAPVWLGADNACTICGAQVDPSEGVMTCDRCGRLVAESHMTWVETSPPVLYAWDGPSPGEYEAVCCGCVQPEPDPNDIPCPRGGE